MTTEYSTTINWYDESRDHPERWVNHGQRVIRKILEDSGNEKFIEVAKALDVLKDDGTLEDYWEECLDSQEPMMNYGYPLHYEPEEEEIINICLKTSCSVMENQDTGEFYLVLNGGGMDLSQSIAHAYMICGYIPDALAFNVSTQYGLNVGGETYFKIMEFIKNSLKDTIKAYENKIKNIDDAVSGARSKLGDFEFLK